MVVMEEYRKVLDRALALGADYADLRVVEEKREKINCKEGIIDQLDTFKTVGVGLRVMVDNGWGFAACSLGGDGFDGDKISSLAEKAVSIGLASSQLQNEKIGLAPIEAVKASHKVKVEEDPFAVPLSDKIKILREAVEKLKHEKIILRSGSMESRWENKLFLSTEGSEIEQEFYITGAGISAMSSDGKERQVRSYPNVFGGDFAQKGFEFVRHLNLVEESQRVKEEAVQLLEAPQCPQGRMTLIIGGSQLALQVHESCGHPIELDRVLGTEAGFAGTSFLSQDKLGKLQYGSSVVNITADATIEGALGSFAYDDEGVPSQRVDIIKDGLFVNYLTSRETAHTLGQQSNGTMRAMGWIHLPIIRMTNINLEPGDSSLEELIKGTQKGVLMDTIKSWSIDDKRINFQFGTQVGWLIEDGEIKTMVKNPTYTGSTVQFWNSCDGVTGRDQWKVWGVPNCGKGEPSQAATVGHGVSHARFQNIEVGVGKW